MSPQRLWRPMARSILQQGRLWRASNPGLEPQARQREVDRLMAARRAVRAALKAGDAQALARARAAVQAAKVALGERGAVWWDDGAPDFNRRMVANSPYARWYEELERGG